MKDPTDPSRPSWQVSPRSTLGRALDAARRREPSADQLRALERSVFGAIVPGTAASPSTRDVPGPPTGAPLATGALKLVALLALASIGTAAGVRWIRRPRSVVPAVADVAPHAAVPASSGEPGWAAEPLPAADLRDATTFRPKAPRPAPRQSSSTRRPARTIDATSPDELELLERADHALATAPGVALSLAESHERLFPAGTMEEEREVIAVSALFRLGRQREARERAARFARKHSGSAYTIRIQRALGRDEQINEGPR
jgi:hypothetical protein